MVMVKPGMIYLDIINKIKEKFKIPVLAYQVSGEYSLIKNAIQKRLLSDEAIIESIVSFKRAGACAIVTYFAIDIAKKIKSISWSNFLIEFLIEEKLNYLGEKICFELCFS